MATIEQAIALSDGVSGPLKKMASAAGNAADRFDHLVSRITGVQATDRALSVTAATTDRITSAAASAATAMGRMAETSANAAERAGKLASQASGIERVAQAATDAAKDMQRLQTEAEKASGAVANVRAAPKMTETTAKAQAAPSVIVSSPSEGVTTRYVTELAQQATVAGAAVSAAGKAGATGMVEVSTSAMAAANGVRKVGDAATKAAEETSAAGTKTLGIFDSMRAKASGVVGSIKANVMSLAGMFTAFFAMDTLTGMMNKAISAAGALGGAELKLKVIMQQRTGATIEDIDAIKQLIGAQQELGVVSRTTQTAGAQQLATFLNEKNSLQSLIPAMNNMLAQQRGANATSEDAIAVANMMGRALMGNVGALTRCGVTLTEEQENMIKYGNEQQRVAALAQAVTDNVGNMNAEIGKTKGGQAAQAMNRVNDALAEVGKKVSGATKDLKIASAGLQIGAIQLFGGALVIAANAATFLASAVSSSFAFITSFVASNIGILEPILAAILAALIVMNAQSVITGLSAMWASAVATAGAIAHAAASAIETAQIIALTIAQEGLNAAIAMCPISWIVMAIVALIAVFYLAIAVVNKFAGTSISATGLIFGAFAWLGTSIMNIVKFVANGFIKFANFLGGLFHDPVTAIYNLFADIWNGVVDLVAQAVNSIIDMVNEIPGIDKVLGHVDHVEYQAMVKREYADGYTSTPKTFEYGDANFNAAQAYEAGKGIADAIESKVQGAADALKKAGEIAGNTPGAPETPVPPTAEPLNMDDINAGKSPSDHVGKIKDNTDKIADGVQQMNEKIDMTEEEMKELRDMALQSTITNWQDNHKIDIHIDQTNQISSDRDVDGMTSDLVEGIREAIDTHAERAVMT